MLERFKKDKIKIEKLINEVLKIIDKNVNLHEELMALKDKAENEIFKLAILGQFKRGKTTLINALIGENLLPVGVLPLTSVITVLKYGKALNVKIIFSGKREKTINIKELALYATEKGNPKNEKNVSVIEVSYPSDYLKRGVEFIDTPGIGSTLLHNTEVTQNYLKNIDAGIFLLSSDLPISQTELEFLRNVKHHVIKLFFVLNTYEHKSDTDINELKKFDKKTLEEELKEKVGIYLLNAKMALDGKNEKNKQMISKSQMQKFESVLSSFFMDEKGSLLILSLKNNLLRVIEESVSYFELNLRAIQLPVEEMELKLKEFQNAAERIKEETENAEPILKSEIGKIMEFIDDDSEKFIAEIKQNLLDKLEKKFNELGDLSKGELISQFQAYYLKSIEEAFEPFYANEEDKVRKRFESLALRFSEIANKTIEDIKSHSSKIFGIKISHIPAKDVFTAPSELYYRVEDAFSMPLEDIGLLLPKFAFRRIYWNKIKSNLEDHLRMNCGRIRGDILYRLNESSTQFLGILDNKVNSIITNTENAIKIGMREKRQKGTKSSGIVPEIENKLNLIKNIKNVIAVNQK